MKTLTTVVLLALAAPALAGKAWLVDVAEPAGMRFRHQAARTPAYLYPETFGAGAALLDLDGDRDLDLLLLDTGAPPGSASGARPRSALFRNVGPGLRFERLPDPDLGGLAAMGACVGDVDGDRDADVYVTGLPAGRLLLNSGGRLAPAPGNGGIEDPGWGTSCAFLDAEGDGDLDLYVAHYVAWTAAAEQTCGGEIPGFRSYCPPDRYPAEPDRLFAGDGRGAFRDVSRASGVDLPNRRGLGVVAADVDADGDTDLFVANDQVPNTLLLNDGGRFRDVALLAGVALSDEGKARAGMGTDAADADGDGDVDLTVTNLDLEANALFLNLAARDDVPRFRDGAAPAGLADPSLMMVGWGVILADLDGDGDTDSFVANGHVMPNVAAIRPGQTTDMRAQLYEQVAPATGRAGPRFVDAAASWRPASAALANARGLAAGDLDDDGDLDLVVTANDGPARLLRNETARPGRWLGVVLEATRSAPGAPGASVTLVGPGAPRLTLRRTGGSYLCASDERVLFGLPGPQPGPSEVLVRWGRGVPEVFGPLAPGRYHVLAEGRGRAPGPGR